MFYCKIWRVQHFEYFGHEHWTVYKRKDTTKPDVPENREYEQPIFWSESDAKEYADRLNRGVMHG